MEPRLRARHPQPDTEIPFTSFFSCNSKTDMSTSTPASATYTPSLHEQSTTIAPIEVIEVNPPQVERIARAGTASSKKADTALIDALDTLRHVRNALQAAERLAHECQEDDAQSVRCATDAALRHAAARIDAALDAIRAADEALADALKASGWPPTTLFDRHRPGPPF